MNDKWSEVTREEMNEEIEKKNTHSTHWYGVENESILKDGETEIAKIIGDKYYIKGEKMKKCNHKIGVSDVMEHISFEFYYEKGEFNKETFDKEECNKYLFKCCPDCGEEIKP